MMERWASLKEKFEEFYTRNKKGHGSGPGSLPVHTKGYVAFLEDFLQSRKIASVVDMGCGDWQFSKYINWGQVHYSGYDIVASVIAKNKENHSAPNISFHLYPGDPQELPAADLIIAKDVLQHWSNQSIDDFLRILPRYKYALLTNCVNPKGETVNVDIAEGGMRHLDLRLPPFSIDAEELYSFTNQPNFVQRLFRRRPRWRKRVLLVKSHAAEVRSDA